MDKIVTALRSAGWNIEDIRKHLIQLFILGWIAREVSESEEAQPQQAISQAIAGVLEGNLDLKEVVEQIESSPEVEIGLKDFIARAYAGAEKSCQHTQVLM